MSIKMKAKHPRLETVQTAVRLPREMYDRLKQGQLGVSGEIRERLALSFDAQSYDFPTGTLAEAVKWMAKRVEEHTGFAWHANPKACEALNVAVHTYLAAIVERPSAEEPNLVNEFVDDPPTLGRVIARDYIRTNPDDDKTLMRMALFKPIGSAAELPGPWTGARKVEL
jgi:hypothetical protein